MNKLVASILKLRVNLFIFSLGFIGIFTVFIMERGNVKCFFLTFDNLLYSEYVFYILFSLLLILSVFLGGTFYQKIDCKMYLFEAISSKTVIKFSILELFKIGLLGALVSSIITLITYKFFEFFDKEQLLIVENIGLSAFKNRLFIRAFTEQIIICYGFMTFFAWFFYFVFKINKQDSKIMAIIFVALVNSIIQYYIVVVGMMGINNLSIFLFSTITKFTISLLYGWMYFNYGLGTSIISRLTLGVFMIVLH